MLKRLSLLLAFIGETKLILLDEPLSTLDADAIAILPQMMIDRYRKSGTSFIYSSHAAFPGEILSISHILSLNNKTLQFSA